MKKTPLCYKYDPEKLSDETKQVFLFSGTAIYSNFQELCNWLYQTKFNYADRKRDSFIGDNKVILTKELVDRIIEEEIFTAVDPEEFNEEVLRSMLSEFIGLEVWAT